MRNINIFIPYNISYTIIENNNTNFKFIYLYSEYYYFSMLLEKKQIFLNCDTNMLYIKNDNYSNYINLFNTEINRFLFSWDSLFFNKVKFTGKGFKFKKKINNLFLFFNRAHKCFFIGNNIILIRLSKNKVILLKSNVNHLIADSKIIRDIRQNNIFTKRGLRFSRQLILKKRGKTATH